MVGEGRPFASTSWRVSCCNHLKAGLDDFLRSIASIFPMNQQDHSAGDSLCGGNGHLGGQDKVRLLLFYSGCYFFSVSYMVFMEERGTK